MSDGTPTLDTDTAAIPGQTAVETEAKEEPVNLETPVAEATGEKEAPEQVADDFDELELDGETYKVPKKLKAGFMMNADYTRKTQELADEKRSFAAGQQTAKQNAEAAQAHVQDVGRVMVMNEQLAEYDKIDWNKLQQDDPFKAQELFQQRTFLKDRRDGLIQQVQYKEQQRSQEAQQSFAKRLAETDDVLAKDIPGWKTTDIAKKVLDFAKARGVTDDNIRAFADNASLVKLLHSAYLGEQLINAKQTAAKTVEPKIEPKPLTKVSGAGARPGLTPFTADRMDDYVAMRKKQGFVGKR